MLEQLDPKQKEVVTTTEGPVLVCAGAGSGKTRSIIYRTAFLASDLGVPPWKILIVTFTNKAARELRERLQDYFHIDFKSFWVGTFHSICAKILRIEAARADLGFDSSYTIFDVDDSLSLLRKVYKEMGIPKSSFPHKTVYHVISRAKNSLLTPANFFEVYQESKNNRVIHNIYTQYQKRLRDNNALDFDDLLMMTAYLLAERPEIKAKYNDKFDYIMIDEYQDTNYAQFRIVKELSGEKRNICVVGDDDQAIYSWRGATIKNILNFSSDFINTKTIRLEQNYRSSQPILDRANKLIAKNSSRHEKTLWTSRIEGEEPQLLAYDTDEQEAASVVEIAEKFMNSTGKETTVILYRTNAQSRLFERTCMDRNIPYKIHGAVNFFQRKEIKDMVAYLRVLINPADSESLLRILNFPPRGIGKTTVQKLLGHAYGTGVSLFEIMHNAPNLPDIGSGIKNRIISFTSIIADLAEKARYLEVTDLIEEVDSITGITEHYKNCTDYKDIVRMENIAEFFAAAKEYADNYFGETGEKPLLQGFLQNISLWTSLDSDFADERKQQEMLNFMTLHNAKGLEYDNVFIVGMEEKLLPHQLCIESKQSLEEERRLVYVGMTRAKKRLFLSYSRFRRSFMGYEVQKASRFLNDIFPEKTAKPSNLQKKPAKPGSRTGKLSAELHQKYSIGQRVKHEKFGEGTILNVDGSETKIKLTVNFDKGKLKKVIASYVQCLTK